MGKNIGQAQLTVRDVFNHLNNDTITVKISPIDNLLSLERYKEMLIDSQDFVFGIATYKNQRFSNCSFL